MFAIDCRQRYKCSLSANVPKLKMYQHIIIQHS
jgi:hypothetical protein